MWNARSSTFSRCAPWVLSLPLLAACGSEAGPSRDVVERDSAGVAIVENPSVGDGGRTFAIVDPEPVLSIGSFDGEEAYQLFRVGGAHRFEDGGLVIVNGGSHQLRFFDAEGWHERSVGGEGEGPGEFRNPTRVWPAPGDSIVVYDSGNQRFSVFDRAGELGRAYALAGDAPYRLTVGFFPDGVSVTQPGAMFRRGEVESGVRRMPVTVELHDREGELLRVLGEWQGGEVFAHTMGQGFMVGPLTFGRQFFSSLSGESVVIATNHEPSFEIVDRSGALRRVVRIAEARVPVEPGAFERARDRALEQAPNAAFREQQRDRYAEMPRHETYPAFSQLSTDRAGRIWLADYRIGDDDAYRWSVFDPEGRALGRVRTPDGMHLLEIGEDYLVGVVRDELDVEHVRVHALRAPEEPETADGPPGED